MTFVKFLYPLLLLLLTIFAIAPLEYPGAFQSHSGLLAYYNLIDLDQNPTQIFAWAPLVGRTFDLFRTEGTLPYLLALVLRWLGFSYLSAIKLVYALAWIASGLTMYAFARRWLSENGALLAAIVYVYLPYHIATVYVRGAFAEAVMWSLFPLALLVLTRPMTDDRRRWNFLVTGLPFTLLFLTQPGLAILFTITALGIIIALHTKSAVSGQRSVISGLGAAVGGLLLGALLYTPTILRYGAHIAREGFEPNYVLPFQLFAALWGWGTSTGSFLDQFPFQLGVVPLGLTIVTIALVWSRENRADATLKRVVIVFLGVAIALAILTFEIAAPLWRVLGAFIIYPWQLLAFVGVALAIVAGALLELDTRLARPTLLAFFIALPIVASYGYLAPRFIAVNPTRPPIAIFGNNEIALLDYRIVGPLRRGATVRVHLTWQALRQVNHDYTVFVHAIHEDGNTYARQDSKPQEGESPTIRWQAGQVILDTHTIQIDVDGPREGYHIELGLYVAATGRRAFTDAGLDFVRVPRSGD
ncbi:MAG: hypothetical protein N2559_05110, partial [Anaerolineae bacterium]|nr:hypothetical protein [Anaerolineae bacterium]